MRKNTYHPKVSIIIPAYNHAKYVTQAIDSILAQNYTNIELIVIDDGSVDHTCDILNSYSDQFIWFSQENIGQALTLAKGWEMSEGNILAYLSADDTLEQDAVSVAVQALNANPAAVAAYPDFNLIDASSRIVRRVQAPEFDYGTMLGDVLCPVGPGAFFRHLTYKKTGSWNPAYKQMPDYDFWLRLGLHGKFIRLPQILASFRVHEESQTFSQTTKDRAEEPVHIINSILSSPQGTQIDCDLGRKARASSHLIAAQLHLRAGRIKFSLKNIGLMLRLKPTMLMSPRMLHLLFNAIFNRLSHRIYWTIRSLFKLNKQVR